jgi:hypothetical protein
VCTSVTFASKEKSEGRASDVVELVYGIHLCAHRYLWSTRGEEKRVREVGLKESGACLCDHFVLTMMAQ